MSFLSLELFCETAEQASFIVYHLSRVAKEFLAILLRRLTVGRQGFTVKQSARFSQEKALFSVQWQAEKKDARVKRGNGGRS